MKTFIDVFSGEELCSDAYPIKLVDDIYYEVEGKVWKRKIPMKFDFSLSIEFLFRISLKAMISMNH